MSDTKPAQPLGLVSSAQLGQAVPNEVMLYVHAYGDARADDDGTSALRIGEAALALRRWAAQLLAAERERCNDLARRALDAATDAEWRKAAMLLEELERPNARGNAPDTARTE